MTKQFLQLPHHHTGFYIDALNTLSRCGSCEVLVSSKQYSRFVLCQSGERFILFNAFALYFRSVNGIVSDFFI
jgi:hypothetical protein